MVNLVSSFYDMKLYGGAVVSGDRLLCENNGAYASLRIQADPLSEITVRCLCKATGTPDDAGLSIAYPSTTTKITSVAGNLNDWQELELKYIVPMDSNNNGYVEIRFGSIQTGTAWFTKPIINVENSNRFAGGIRAACSFIVNNGTATLNSSFSNFGIESIAIDASLLWLNVTLSKGYAAAGSALLPIVNATLDPNTVTSVGKLMVGNYGGTANKTFKVYAISPEGNNVNLSTANIRAHLSVIGY